MTDQKLTEHETRLIRDFEQTYDAQVSAKGHKIKAHQIPAFYHAEHKWKQTVETEPAYQVAIGQADLVQLVRVLHDQEWHDHVQNRYPHLREAYMSYLSQVYLTVDSLNRY